MEIRRASLDDAPAITEVFLRARAQMSYLPRLHTPEETHAFFREVVLRDAEVWLATDAGVVVGLVVVEHRMVDHLNVAPEAQGRGIGSALLDRAKALQPAGLELWVFQQNVGARRFYERHAFQVVELTDGAANEERVPDARYAWRPGESNA